MATRYVDFTGGNDANDGTTFANRKKTITSAMTGLTAGDHTIRLMASPAASSVGNATWTNGSDTVTLAGAVTANIDDGENAWTASANVTATASTATYREGTKSANLVIASGFTTGLVAYKALAGATDFSAYQQISTQIRSSGSIASGVFELKLCSDAAGATPVNTITIGALPTNLWIPHVVDTLAALGSSIQSVALYAVSDPGAVTINLDNIIACKASASADSLTHNSLISKNTDSNEPWFTIDSINGTTVKLGSGYNGAAKGTNTTRYWGTTDTVTTYKREPHLVTATQQLTVSGGGDTTTMKVEGGWNTTDMSTQTDVTWVRPTVHTFSLFGASALNYTYHNKVYAAGVFFASGHAFAFASGGDGHRLGEVGVAGSFAAFRFHQMPSFYAADIKYLVGNLTAMDFASSCTGFEWLLRIRKLWGCSNTSGDGCWAMNDSTLTRAIGKVTFNVDEVKGCNFFGSGTAGSGIQEMRFNNSAFASNQFDVRPMANGRVYGNNTTIDITKCSVSGGQRYHFTKYNQTADDHRNYFDDTSNSTILSATDQRHTASDISWKFSPKTATITEYRPLAMSIARVACNSGEARTVTIWARRNNTALSMRLKVKGGQLAGVASDVTDDISGAADTWDQLSVTFTPSEAGVIDVTVEAWGGVTHSGWFDDLEVT